MQVIKQFEEFDAPDVVVSLAKTAISIADSDDVDLVCTILTFNLSTVNIVHHINFCWRLLNKLNKSA